MGAVRRLPDLSLLLRARRFFLWAVSGFSLPGAAAKSSLESSHRRGFDLPCRALSPSKLNAPKKEGGSETGRHKKDYKILTYSNRAGNKKTLCEWVPHSHRVFVCPFTSFLRPQNAWLPPKVAIWGLEVSDSKHFGMSAFSSNFFSKQILKKRNFLLT